ncbi:hypothetical protein Daus18300_003875 [Diaporthe australafricana]|uniref:Tail specific protease domain-containing protein n=1 Tax=Diaporthe australafricana TaxID=127596 RepID=A0ABR3XC36_9PEZI
MAILQWITTLLSLSLFTRFTRSQSTEPACGQIVNALDGQDVFNASLVYDCLSSVPFNSAVATRLIAYWNDTLQFQSTLTYLKSPPASYQQPAVDLLAELSELQDAVSSGAFSNQYEFEVALQLLLVSAHDAHLYLNAGILAAFTFASPFDIVSLSIDGIELPKVYLAAHVYDSNSFTTYQPSAIKSINGQEVTSYLDSFASNNSYGGVEGHADWNQLMLSGAQDVQGNFNAFSGNTLFYPGDNITFLLENGTTVTDKYLGVYWSQGPTGPLETGGDFYNFFVLGFWPASFDPSSDDDSTDGSSSDGSASDDSASTTATATAAISTPTQTGWGDSEFWYPPTADVAQPDLGLYEGGYITGYLLNTSATSVLSIPSFDMLGDALSTAQTTVDQFLNVSKSGKVEKLVIDLQQNTGGEVLLAFDIFKRLFPNIDPYGGSRMRAHKAADAMGSSLTGYYTGLPMTDPEYEALAADEWIATTRIDAETNVNFTSWAEFYGPYEYNGDTFTANQRYNLSSEVFTSSAIGEQYGSFAVYEPPSGTTPAYSAENIVLLTDGICGSSCALFVEMMHHQAGVKVVVVGGRPTTGPMQGVAAGRGARSYSLGVLDANIDFAQSLLASAGSPDANFLPNRTTANDVYIIDAGVNLRDQVRQGDELPLQFTYEAADCRIFWTPKTSFNYAALWQYTADAIWSNASLCVAGSTGYSGSGSKDKDDESLALPMPSPKPSSFNMTEYLSSLDNQTPAVDSSDLENDLSAGGNVYGRGRSATFRDCSKNASGGYSCSQGYQDLQLPAGDCVRWGQMRFKAGGRKANDRATKQIFRILSS